MSAAAASATGAADELVDNVMTASRVLVDIAARSIARSGVDISLPQYRTLVLLVTRGPQRGRDLAALLDVNPSSATRVVERLHRARLVRRIAVEGDRRTHLVAPTQAGRDVVAAVTEGRRAEMQSLLTKVPDELREPIVKGLRALVDAAEEPDEQALRAGLATTDPRHQTSTGTWLALLALLAALAAAAGCSSADQRELTPPFMPCTVAPAPPPGGLIAHQDVLPGWKVGR